MVVVKVGDASIASEVLIPHGQDAAPDLNSTRDGPEWSRAGLKRFLASCEQRMVVIQRDPWDPKSGDVYAAIGYQGFSYPVLKGRPVMVPWPIAEIVEQSQQEFATAQAKNQEHYIRDIGNADGPQITVQ